jgi:hypothetical protein
MPKRRLNNAVRLEFKPGALVHSNLSGAAFTGDYLWVAGDEAAGIDRLRRLNPVGSEMLRFGESTDFPLASLLDLPGAAEEEADLEGMATDGEYLWVVGSHGLKRKNAKPDRDDAENARRLAKTALDGNRRLLARIPIETGADGVPVLKRVTDDGRAAIRLKGDAATNPLTEWMADDIHFGPYLKIPGKDNGFDIEGLAVFGNRLLLGLRGPVLRGWSAILEIAVDVSRSGEFLKLVPIGEKGELVRKHFIQLEGLGIRDLHFSGDDLYILGGPTMVLNGDIRVFRWTGARQALLANEAAVTFEESPSESVSLPHGRGTNRAEAICDLPTQHRPSTPCWLVLYDAPGADRKDGEYTVFGDLLQHD